jgi:phage baseplate assembly protein W
MTMYTTYPYQLDNRGHTAITGSTNDHIRQMLEQLLLTRPGERVNRPDFGCGVGNLVFEPNSTRLAAALEVAIVTSVGQWLGDLIQLQNVDIESQDEKLLINISYLVQATGQQASTTVALTAPT